MVLLNCFNSIFVKHCFQRIVTKCPPLLGLPPGVEPGSVERLNYPAVGLQ